MSYIVAHCDLNARLFIKVPSQKPTVLTVPRRRQREPLLFKGNDFPHTALEAPC